MGVVPGLLYNTVPPFICIWIPEYGKQPADIDVFVCFCFLNCSAVYGVITCILSFNVFQTECKRELLMPVEFL